MHPENGSAPIPGLQVPAGEQSPSQPALPGPPQGRSPSSIQPCTASRGRHSALPALTLHLRAPFANISTVPRPREVPHPPPLTGLILRALFFMPLEAAWDQSARDLEHGENGSPSASLLGLVTCPYTPVPVPGLLAQRLLQLSPPPPYLPGAAWEAHHSFPPSSDLSSSSWWGLFIKALNTPIDSHPRLMDGVDASVWRRGGYFL